MPKRVRRIDAQWLDTCRPARRQEWGVRQHLGLRVRVGPTSASFYYYGTEHDSRGVAKRVSYCLGSWPDTSLKKAAEAMRKLRDAGPTGRIAERWTVRAVLADLEKEKLSHQKKGHEVAAVLRLHAMEARPAKGSPPFGDWRAAQVERVHLTELVRGARTQSREGSIRRGGLGASRSLGKALRVLFAHASEIGAADRNVADALKAGASTPRNVWLSTKEQLVAFFEAVDLRALLAGEKAPSSTSRTVRLGLAFLAIVPTRRDAFRLATWDEVDFEAETWTVPTARLKSTEARRRLLKPMVIPLPPTAVRIMRVLQAERRLGNPYVLPAPGEVDPKRGPQPLNAATLVRALTRMQIDQRLVLPSRLSVHDLRRSWSSWAASGQCRVPPAHVELVLGHSLKSSVSSTWGTYVHSDHGLEDRRRALETVDAFYRQVWDRKLARVRELGEASA